MQNFNTFRKKYREISYSTGQKKTSQIRHKQDKVRRKKETTSVQKEENNKQMRTLVMKMQPRKCWKKASEFSEIWKEALSSVQFSRSVVSDPL